MDAHERGKTMPHPTSVDARPTGYLPLTAALSALLTSGGMLHGAADAQVVVDNSLESAWTSTAEWTLEEDLRIGGPPGGYLTMVVAVAADSRDNIYILDYVTQEIHVFDPEGGFLRTLGGQGDGPGEFRDALGPAIAPGDTLWVADQRAPRYSIFGPDGTFLRTRTRRGASSGGARTERCTIARDGSYMEWLTRYPKEEKTGDMADIDLLHFHPIRVSRNAEEQDTLPHLEFTQQMADMPSLGMRRPVHFGPDLRLAWGCSGDLWFALSGEYRLYRRSLEGDTTLIATLDGVRAADIDEADRDEVRAMFQRRPNPALMGDYLFAGEDDAGTPYVTRLRIRR